MKISFPPTPPTNILYLLASTVWLYQSECNRSICISDPLFCCLCIVLKLPAIFQIAEHQVHLEVDKYVEPSVHLSVGTAIWVTFVTTKSHPLCLSGLCPVWNSLCLVWKEIIPFLFVMAQTACQLSVCSNNIHPPKKPIFYFFIDRSRVIFHLSVRV